MPTKKLLHLSNNFEICPFFFENWTKFFHSSFFSKQETAHKGLNSAERFTNLPSDLVLSILNLMGLMNSYGFPGVPQSPKSYDALLGYQVI